MAVVDHHELQLVGEVHLAVYRAEVAGVNVEMQVGAVVAEVVVQRLGTARQPSLRGGASLDCLCRLRNRRSSARRDARQCGRLPVCGGCRLGFCRRSSFLFSSFLAYQDNGVCNLWSQCDTLVCNFNDCNSFCLFFNQKLVIFYYDTKTLSIYWFNSSDVNFHFSPPSSASGGIGIQWVTLKILTFPILHSFR